jgi:hypothetical protein
MSILNPNTEKKMWIDKKDTNFKKVLQEIKMRFGGSAGGPESESILNWCKGDSKEGWVSFWTDNKDASNLITRSKKYILAVRLDDAGVEFKMDKKGFRSSITAFKVGR